MKTKLSLTTLIFLLSCTPATSSLLSSSSSPLFSSDTSSLSSSSQTSLSTSSTVLSSSSANVSSASDGVTSSSESPSLASIWQSPMAIINPSLFYSETQTLTNNLSKVKVTQVAAIYRADQSFYGMAYEALVDGNFGPNSIRFRIGFVDGKFAALTMVSHNEHGGFGLKIIQALLIQLPDKPATMSTVTTILINANANRTGISETYDGMIPAIEAMVVHYTAEIQ